MIEYDKFDLYMEESVDKQLQIAFDGGTITNKEIPSEQFSLTESLSSDGLMFGSCEASEIKFRIYNVFTPLKDKWLTVTQVLDKDYDNPLQIGKYKVYSDKPTANRRYRDVVAYDQMYDIINADLTEWYNSLFPTDSTTVTLKEFRTSLMNYLGVEQEDITLVNDYMVIKKTIQPTQLAGRDVISAICEINGCFGHIGRDGKFHYVFLAKRIQGLYPANDLYPQDNLFPREQVTNKIDKSLYIDCQYEDYLSQEITKLQIRQEENDIGKTYPGGETTDLDNTYVVQGNFLVYGKEETELEDIAKKLFSVISGTEYRPYEAKAVGNPCFEVGDAIRFNTAYQIVESYILKRTLSGVQGLRDELSADGEEYLSENAGGIESQIQQLKGKSNVLERNINETVSKISDVEQGLQSEIRQTAESITQTVEANYETKTDAGTTKKELQSEIKQTADEITQNVSATYETIQSASATKSVLESQIEQTAESITRTVSATYETKTDAGKTKKELQTSIEQTAESITSTVASSQSKWDTTGVTVNIYGYGSPKEQYNPFEYSSLYYLDQSNGYLYLATTTEWIFVTELELITDELSSQIEQAVGSIVLKVDANGKIVEVALTGDPEEGTTFKVDADNIDLSAEEVISLMSNGNLDLSGKNITISSDNLIVDENGLRIIGGSIKGTNISATDSFKMLCYYNSLRSGYETVLSTMMRSHLPSQIPIYGDSTIILLGNDRFPVAFYGVPSIFTGSVLENVLYAVNNTTLGTIDYLTMSSNTSKGTYIHCQTTFAAYGITIWESDTKLKTNILETEQAALDKINQLEFIQFDWKKNGGHVDLGLSANQVEEIIPNAVFEVEQGAGSEYDTLKNIDTPTLTTYSLKAIQEMSKIIETQQQEIDTLKEQVSFLMKKLGDDVNG